MPEVYEVIDDDVVVIRPAQRRSSSDDGRGTTTKERLSLGASDDLSRDTSHINKTTHSISHAINPLMNGLKLEEEDITSGRNGSPLRSTSPPGRGDEGEGEDVKMDYIGGNPRLEPEPEMETDVEKRKESSTHLPILDSSDPAPQPGSSSNNNINANTKPSSSSASASPPAAVNGLVPGGGDEKSKKPASTSVKPKSKRRSPSPEPLPPPPPRVQTIRLDLPLGGPNNYAIDVLQLSKETGQRPPTPPPVKRDTDTSESEGEGDAAAAGLKGIGKGKGRGKAGRKSAAAEYYDLNDPFIDDSELAIDERSYIALTKQQGFYVSSGEVALLKDKSRDTDSRERDGAGAGAAGGGTPKKPKSKRNIVPTIIPLAGSQAVNAAVASSAGLSAAAGTGASASGPPLSQPAISSTDPFASQPLTVPGPGGSTQGTRETPITLSDTEEGRISSAAAAQPSISPVSANGFSVPAPTSANSAPLKRKASETSTNGKKKRKTIEIESFHPELQASLYELKDAISRESFDQKGKFPPALKPILARVALKAIAVGEYNDNFFALMPKLFIYNKYTMTKLIKRTVYVDHQKLLVARQDELIEELRVLAEEGFEKAKEEYEKSVQAWERRQAYSKANGGTSLEGTPVPGSSTPSVNGVPLPPATQLDGGGGGGGGADSSMEVDSASGAPPLTQPSASSGADKGGGHVHSSQHMPIQRFRLTERMRNIIWELVVLSNESVRIENEKNTLENSTVQVSEQGTRKVLYQKVVAAFPEGWMSSGQISREVSVMKKRYEAQQAEGVS